MSHSDSKKGGRTFYQRRQSSAVLVQSLESKVLELQHDLEATKSELRMVEVQQQITQNREAALLLQLRKSCSDAAYWKHEYETEHRTRNVLVNIFKGMANSILEICDQIENSNQQPHGQNGQKQQP